jgi:hypothetical protein
MSRRLARRLDAGIDRSPAGKDFGPHAGNGADGPHHHQPRNQGIFQYFASAIVAQGTPGQAHDGPMPASGMEAQESKEFTHWIQLSICRYYRYAFRALIMGNRPKLKIYRSPANF